MDWYATQQENEYQATQNLSNTDEAFKLYSEMHPDYTLKEPKFSDYYRPSSDQKIGEMVYVGRGMLALGYIASKWL